MEWLKTIARLGGSRTTFAEDTILGTDRVTIGKSSKTGHLDMDDIKSKLTLDMRRYPTVGGTNYKGTYPNGTGT